MVRRVDGFEERSQSTGMQRLGGDASSIIRTPRTHGGKRLCLPAGAHRELRCTHARMHARTHKWQPRVRPDWDPRLEASCSAKCERGQTRFCHPEPRWQNRVWLRAAQASASAGVVVQRAITGAHSLEYADPQCAGERAPHVPSPRHPLHPAQHYRCCGLILAGLSNITTVHVFVETEATCVWTFSWRTRPRRHMQMT
jgi:hypothetical protein